MPKLSAIVTTKNNARTLEYCLQSLAFADEIVLLDTFSTDQTLEIARAYGCEIYQHEFLGYGRQKQSAVDKTSHDWVLVLDADEAISRELAEEIQAVLRNTPTVQGYALARCEQIFWRMGSLNTAMNHHLRLFDKRSGGLSDMPVHAAPKVDGEVVKLKYPFFHFGEPDLQTKVDRINAYSTGLLSDKLAKRSAFSFVHVTFYPIFFFFKLFVLKRNFLNGWAGFFTSVVGAFYVFLKYAKLKEHQQFEKYGDSLLPAGAPENERARSIRETPK